MTRIYADKTYLGWSTPGISGFQRWGEKEWFLAIGAGARNRRPEVDREYVPTEEEKFRLGDGHLPESQPVVTGPEAVEWLREHPYCLAYFIEEPKSETIDPPIDRCPVCKKPGHASETDDLGRHLECQPEEERYEPEGED